LRNRLGFPLAAIPLIMLVGGVYLMVSLPSLFELLARFEWGPAYVQASLRFLAEQAQRLAARADELSYSGPGVWLIRLSLFVLPALWLASLIRSVVVRSWRPFVITFSATSLGAIGIPIATWVGECLVVMWRVGETVARFIATYILSWLLPVLFWVFIAAVAVGALYGVFVLVRFLAREHLWLQVLAVAAVAGAIVGLAYLGWLGWLWTALVWLWSLIAPVIEFLVGIIGWLLIWAWRILVVVVVFVFVAGLAVSFLGEAGRQVFLPLRSAAGAGRDRGRCADLAAGVGVGMSLALTAAVLDPVFGSRFAAVWETTPLINRVPLPIDMYDALLPSAAEDILRPAFVGFLPILDVGVLVIAAGIGVLSLLFASAYWEATSDSRVIRPVLLGVGGAISVAVLVLVVALLFGGTDSG
jgi:hypothetical protein